MNKMLMAVNSVVLLALPAAEHPGKFPVVKITRQ